jgi:hypothetical protein
MPRHARYSPLAGKVEQELRRDPARTNRGISEGTGTSEYFVRRIRVRLEREGKLPKVFRRTGIDGKVYTTALFRQVRKSPAEREAEIRSMLAAGHNIEQISTAITMSTEMVRRFIRAHNIPVAALVMRRSGGNTKEPVDVVEAVVNTLVAAAASVDTVPNFSLPHEEAASLLPEVSAAMHTLRGFHKRLKELSHDSKQQPDGSALDVQGYSPAQNKDLAASTARV